MKSSSQRRHFVCLSLVAGCLAAGAAVAADSVPVLMQVPAGNYVAWRAAAEGVVTYVCQQSASVPSVPVWAIQGAKATLAGDNQQANYTSPPETWRAADGSSLTGMQVVSVNVGAPRLPDQLVMANPARGAGMLSGVTYIQRLVQAGGGVPAEACDAATLGKKVDKPYQASYVFWKPN